MKDDQSAQKDYTVRDLSWHVIYTEVLYCLAGIDATLVTVVELLAVVIHGQWWSGHRDMGHSCFFYS